MSTLKKQQNMRAIVLYYLTILMIVISAGLTQAATIPAGTNP